MANIRRVICVALLLGVVPMEFPQVSLCGGAESPHSFFPIYPADTPPGVNTCPVPQANCARECDKRCSSTQHKKACLTFCNPCCNKCLCVPPGTFGNKECCACYNIWKAKEGGPKCP